MFETRTDLAIEAGELYREQNPDLGEIDGVKTEIFETEKYTVTSVLIENETGERAFGKPIGTYITIESGSLLQNDITAYDEISEIIKKELSKLLGDTRGKTILVAGLGNRDITPDSIGPKVISRLLVTRHIFSEMPSLADSLYSVCAVAPGVLGITGIETGEILKGIIEKAKPDIIIVIDALAARKIERVSTTVQISDTGIIPGSGVANSRKALNRESLGIPTIAIGIPMVVDAATLVRDSLAAADAPAGKHEDILKNVLKSPTYMICPKDIDALSERISHVLAQGINMALQKNLSAEEILSLTAK